MHALDSIAENHEYDKGFNGVLMDFRFRSLKEYIRINAKILEMGPAEGHMTRNLAKMSDDITVVDGSQIFLERLKERIPKIKAINSLFESLDLSEKFDVILLCHVLEHIDDPVNTLRNLAKNCHEDTIIIVSVPNAYSVHRILGVKMGLLKDVHEMNEADHKIGHKRVYDFKSLEEDVSKAGFKIVEKKGVFFKPFSNSQMEEFTADFIEGFYKLGEEFPENCAEIMFVLRK